MFVRVGHGSFWDSGRATALEGIPLGKGGEARHLLECPPRLPGPAKPQKSPISDLGKLGDVIAIGSTAASTCGINQTPTSVHKA